MGKLAALQKLSVGLLNRVEYYFKKRGNYDNFLDGVQVPEFLARQYLDCICNVVIEYLYLSLTIVCACFFLNKYYC